jgi:hypothetical protein
MTEGWFQVGGRWFRQFPSYEAAQLWFQEEADAGRYELLRIEDKGAPIIWLLARTEGLAHLPGS